MVTQNVAQNPPHHVTYALAKFLRPTVKEDMHLQENALFDLDLRIKYTQNIAQYSTLYNVHHVTMQLLN